MEPTISTSGTIAAAGAGGLTARSGHISTTAGNSPVIKGGGGGITATSTSTTSAVAGGVVTTGTGTTSGTAVVTSGATTADVVIAGDVDKGGVEDCGDGTEGVRVVGALGVGVDTAIGASGGLGAKSDGSGAGSGGALCPLTIACTCALVAFTIWITSS